MKVGCLTPCVEFDGRWIMGKVRRGIPQKSSFGSKGPSELSYDLSVCRNGFVSDFRRCSANNHRLGTEKTSMTSSNDTPNRRRYFYHSGNEPDGSRGATRGRASHRRLLSGSLTEDWRRARTVLYPLPNSNKSYGKFPAAEEMVGYGHPDEFEEELRAY